MTDDVEGESESGGSGDRRRKGGLFFGVGEMVGRLATQHPILQRCNNTKPFLRKVSLRLTWILYKQRSTYGFLPTVGNRHMADYSAT
jgi:hypothetical protein